MITPNRQTRLVLDVPEVQLLQPAWNMRRGASQMHAARIGGDSSTNVFNPGPWILRPPLMDWGNIPLSTYEPYALGSDDLALADNWGEVQTFRKDSDLTGVSPSGSLVTSGVPAITKRVGAGESWNTELTSDLALPKPTEDTANYPMNRVAAGYGTYPANAIWALGFNVPHGGVPPDVIATLYFGGQTETFPMTQRAGLFCVTVRGSGELILREYTGSAWRERARFQPAIFQGGAEAGTASLGVLLAMPFGRDYVRLALGTTFGDSGTSPLSALINLASIAVVNSLNAGGGGAGRQSSGLYQNDPLVTGFTKPFFSTGPGSVRLDVGRNLRGRFTIARYLYPTSGVLHDLPFHVPYGGAAPSLGIVYMYWRVQAYLPSGTSMSVTITHVPTNTACTPVLGTNAVIAIAGEQTYRMSITFSSSNGTQTPVLFGYEVYIPANSQSRTPTATYGGAIQRISIEGADVDPSHESAHVSVEDLNNQLAVLRTRARQRAGVWIYNSAGTTLRSILFDGEIARADRTPMSRNGVTWPNAWSSYEITLAGIWERLGDALALDLSYFHEDPTTLDYDGSYAPWKITDIIVYLLLKAGFPAATINIPDYGVRLWTRKGFNEDLTLQPTQSIAQALLKFARDYLGGILIWCPNDGSIGQWRLIYAPAQAASIATFVAAPQAGKLAMYTPDTSTTAEIVDETYREWIVPPEGNYVKVVGAGGSAQFGAEIYNPVSFDFKSASSDPTSIDYLGRFVPILHVDGTITTPAQAVWVARRIYDSACHGQRWFSFQAPLLLLNSSQTGDTNQVRERALRIGDKVTVAGSTALLRSVNPDWDGSDNLQMATYEGYYL